MRCVYDTLASYFNDGPWELSGASIEALDMYVKTHMWPFESGDYIVRRWINSGLATCAENTLKK